MKTKFLENEYWYGGIVHIGARLPIGADSDIHIDLVGGEAACDQYSPLFLSSKGRILHGDKAFNVHFNKGEIIIDDAFSVELLSGFGTLKGATLEAARRWFSLCGKHPELRFFRSPQYNTWIELMYNQNQDGILEYARTLRENGMPDGVLMIDEGWAPNYGIYDFDKTKFNDPKAMVAELHALGFSVMLWITPHISPDSACFREIRGTGLLLHDKNEEIAIRKWWNGYSAVLDFTNPETRGWFAKKLKFLMDRYGIDGFKFDSGDTYLFRDDDKAFTVQEANKHTTAFNKFAEEYRFNELRNVWDCGGASLICRLQDKLPIWSENGLASLLPNTLTQGVLGYYYGCPDMVGGGSFSCFLDPSYKTDEELYLRWLSASVLCPMMQFSISPKRILSEKSFAAVQKLLAIREKYTEKIISLVKAASVSGEPIVRYMEYEFPGQGYEKITDEFMLGSDTLVAPILVQGAGSRSVRLPEGRWTTENGDVLDGGKEIILSAALDELIVLTRV